MILIALGANLPSAYGAPEETLEAAKVALQEQGVRILASSQIWLTTPVPVSDQDMFRNAVLAVDTSLSPESLLELLLSIERDFGRVRGAKNEARVLDLDLISYDKQIFEQGDLILPHPRLHERGFVLHPLREVAPDWMHPVLNLSVDIMIGNLPDDQDARPLKTEAA